MNFSKLLDRISEGVIMMSVGNQEGLKSTDKERVCGYSSVGRTPPCQGEGREFESRCPLFFL